MRNLVVFGIGEFAELVSYYFSTDSKYKQVAFTIEKEYIRSSEFLGFPLIDFEKLHLLYPPEENDIFIAVGYSRTNSLRAKFYEMAYKKGYQFASFISESALVSNNSIIGNNCMVLEGAIVQPFVEIGNGVVIWSGAHIGHHSKVQNFCFIAPNAAISGKVNLSERCFVGINATIRDGINIGCSSIIGAGTVILNDVEDGSVYRGLESTHLPISSDHIRRL
ncbi:acetyltransferase [Cohnella sp. GbtcB17]|uniref:acetyltransferase n=1 Tax=Cohnella sp. GbtcB17 TaxID=2824762 RepID=UPI001C2F5F17|nr:acetyltransferase [Cohnella sp. GbtcB17]